MIKAAVALGDTAWEAELIATFGHPKLQMKVVRRCVDGIDVLANVKVHEIDAVILGDQTLRINKDVIAQIQDLNVQIIALTTMPEHWHQLGVQLTVPIYLQDLFRSAELIADTLAMPAIDQVDSDVPDRALICVASFGGGVGRSFVTRELGWALAKLGRPVVVVEADIYGPSISEDLNLPANILDIAQLAEQASSAQTGQLDIEQLAFLAENLAIVPGISNYSGGLQLHRVQIERLFNCLRQQLDVLVDAGPVFNAAEINAYDIGQSSSDILPNVAVNECNRLIFCATATSTSVTRLIRGVIENQESLLNKEITVVLNRCRDQSTATELTRLIYRYAGISNVVVLPDDALALGKCEIKTEFLAKQNPKHEMVQQIQSLAHALSTEQKLDLTKIQNNRLQQITAAA